MAIYRPGERFRYHRLLSRKGGKKGVTANLDLTAMVDMFTVLVVFLLQNYNTTGEVLFLPKEVTLPKASSTKDLKPAVVVTISDKDVLLDKDVVVSTQEFRNSPGWYYQPLQDKIKLALANAKERYDAKIQKSLKEVVSTVRGQETNDNLEWSKVTIQADKGIEYRLVKKVLVNATEAGAGEMSFAVNKLTEKK
jgi:biopolymer transport protein ExbD